MSLANGEECCRPRRPATADLSLRCCCCCFNSYLFVFSPPPISRPHVRIGFLYAGESFLVRFPAGLLLRSPPAPPPPLVFLLWDVCKSLSFYSSSWCIPAPCENIPNAAVSYVKFHCPLLLYFHKFSTPTSLSLSVFHVTISLYVCPKCPVGSLSFLLPCRVYYSIFRSWRAE